LLDNWNSKAFYSVDYWHDSVNDHCLEDCQAHIDVPFWSVILEGAVKELLQVMSNKVLIFQVSIDQQDQETGVEELSIEHTVGNQGLLFRFSVLTDPETELNDNSFENNVHSNNNKGNTLSQNLTPQDIIGVVLANRLVEDNLAFLCLGVGNILLGS
jgi:hypothetical protein